MIRTEFMLQDTYGLTADMKEKFRNYYYNLENLNAAKAVDVCYRILCDAVEAREKEAAEDETGYFREYISEAVAYIQEHLQEEDLSIVSVAAHIYLNPVYFGRVFKNTFHMTFKKYLKWNEDIRCIDPCRPSAATPTLDPSACIADESRGVA